MSKDRRPAQSAPSMQQPEEPQYDSPLLLLTRLYWMGFGPIFAVLLLIAVASSVFQWLTAIDAGYAAIVALMPAARWLEFRMGKAEKSTGVPATLQDIRNYTLVVAAGGLGAWIIAKGLSTYLRGK